MFGPRNDVVLPFERQRARQAVRTQRNGRRGRSSGTRLLDDERRRRRGHANERDSLNVGSVGIAWLEPDALELFFEVVNRRLSALGAGSPALLFTGRDPPRLLNPRANVDGGRPPKGHRPRGNDE